MSAEESPLADNHINLMTFVNGVLFLSCLGFALFNFNLHVASLYQLHQQKNIVRLEFMGPIFALLIYLQCLLHGSSIQGIFELLQVWYDGYALYVFWCLVVQAAGGKEEVLKHFRSKGNYSCYFCGCCKLMSFETADSFFNIRYKHLIFQVTYFRSFLYFLTAILEMIYGHNKKRHLLILLRLCSIPSLVLCVVSIITFYYHVEEKIKYMKNMKAIFLSVKTFIILVVIENVIMGFFTGHETYNNFSHSQKATFFQAYVTLIMLECVLYTIIFAIYSTPEHFRKDHTGIEIVAQDSTWSILLYEACMLWKVLDFEGDGHYRLNKGGSMDSEYGTVNNLDATSTKNIELNYTVSNPALKRVND